MNFHLTQDLIRQRASAQSFQKGVDYYRSGAIFNPSWQETPDSIMLLGNCEGSSGSTYSIRVQLGSTGIQDAVCTCPYDWGGDCKHIIALLLTYLNRREDFTQMARPLNGRLILPTLEPPMHAVLLCNKRWPGCNSFRASPLNASCLKSIQKAVDLSFGSEAMTSSTSLRRMPAAFEYLQNC